MGDGTAISWTDATWTPIRGIGINRWFCQKVSPGCDNCYASRLNVRFGGQPYLEPACKDDMREAVDKGLIRLDEKVLNQPRHWKRPRKVFVCSMTDLFGEWVDKDWLWEVFNVMDGCPQHTFQILTKRTRRMRDVLLEWQRVGYEPGPNVWLGTSVESQAFAWRLNYLCETPAAVRFVSAEPLLGPLDLRQWLQWPDCRCSGEFAPCEVCDAEGPRTDIHWIIDGGESGPGYRPANPDWFRSLRDQCQAAGVSYFHKQDGGPRAGTGMLLDGREWHEFPQAVTA